MINDELIIKLFTSNSFDILTYGYLVSKDSSIIADYRDEVERELEAIILGEKTALQVIKSYYHENKKELIGMLIKSKSELIERDNFNFHYETIFERENEELFVDRVSEVYDLEILERQLSQGLRIVYDEDDNYYLREFIEIKGVTLPL